MHIFFIIEIPKLPEISEPEQPEEPVEPEDEEAPAKVTKSKRSLKTSGPKIVDPYTGDQSSSLIIPLIIAIAAVIPVIFCLCRL